MNFVDGFMSLDTLDSLAIILISFKYKLFLYKLCLNKCLQNCLIAAILTSVEPLKLSIMMTFIE